MSDRYCVIGNPIAHSKSPVIQAAFAEQLGHSIVYERCLAPLDGFAATVQGLIEAGYQGANVTVPFKLEAAALAQTLSDRARAAGAVNTLVFGGGTIHGDNTDGAGLAGDVVRNAGLQLAGKRVLLLGAGGAARGVILPLLSEGPASITIANRTRATADELVRIFAPHAAPGQTVSASDYAALAAPYDLVINGTSTSLNATMPPVPAVVFTTGTLAYDMMYGNKASPFMEFAAAQGATARDGLGMLVEQAAEAFFVWRGVRPATHTILEQMRRAL